MSKSQKIERGISSRSMARTTVALLLSIAVLVAVVPFGYTADPLPQERTATLGPEVLKGPNPALAKPTGHTVSANEPQHIRRDARPSSVGPQAEEPSPSLQPPAPLDEPRAPQGRSPSRGLRSRPLKVDQPVAQILRSGFLVSRVGGIAFDQTAVPSEGLKVEHLSLRYDPRRTDGSRLVVTLNGQEYSPADLPDWQLYPIAQFADSPYFAAVTLFGELDEGVGPPEGTKYVVSFHPALEGTLLGLRIFQGDFYLLDPNATGELPKFDGQYLLRTGERPPDRASWMPAAVAMNRILAEHGQFQSYVICDAASPPRLKAAEREKGPPRLELLGNLYFFFWKAGAPREEQVADSLRGRVRYRSFKVVHLRELSAAVSTETGLLRRANPAVYHGMLQTMLYSAFFRYCRQNDRDGWKEFLDSLDQIPPETYVAPTPAVVGDQRLLR